MKEETKNWIITGLVILVAASLSIFTGFAIVNMTEGGEKPAKDVTIHEKGKNGGDPGSSEDGTGVERKVKRLSAEELSLIAEGFDSAVSTYYTTGETDEDNRPLASLRFQEAYAEQFPDKVHVFQRNAQTVAVCFVLAAEYNANTAYVLDQMKTKGVKCTFFISKGYAIENPDIVSRIIREGHTLGSLGTALPKSGLASLSLTEQQDDIMEMHEYILENFGYEMSDFYYVYEKYSEQSIALLAKMGYRADFFTIYYADYDPDAEIDSNAFLNQMATEAHGGAVFLFHTTNTATLLVAPHLIDDLRKQGYTVGLLN